MTMSGPLQARMTSFLAFIFFFSGFASLMYQIAWQRLLTLHYGVGAISITLIVSVYMLGLGVGGLVGGALAERIRDKLTLYFGVQLLLALFGFVSVPFLVFIGDRTAGSSYVLSLWYMALFLIVPTVLMGMTLPLLTKIFNRFVEEFLSTVSYLYFLNTVGAACGALFASLPSNPSESAWSGRSSSCWWIASGTGRKRTRRMRAASTVSIAAAQ